MLADIAQLSPQSILHLEEGCSEKRRRCDPASSISSGMLHRLNEGVLARRQTSGAEPRNARSGRLREPLRSLRLSVEKTFCGGFAINSGETLV